MLDGNYSNFIKTLMVWKINMSLRNGQRKGQEKLMGYFCTTQSIDIKNKMYKCL